MILDSYLDDVIEILKNTEYGNKTSVRHAASNRRNNEFNEQYSLYSEEEIAEERRILAELNRKLRAKQPPKPKKKMSKSALARRPRGTKNSRAYQKEKAANDRRIAEEMKRIDEMFKGRT